MGSVPNNEEQPEDVLRPLWEKQREAKADVDAQRKELTILHRITGLHIERLAVMSDEEKAGWIRNNAEDDGLLTSRLNLLASELEAFASSPMTIKARILRSGLFGKDGCLIAICNHEDSPLRPLAFDLVDTLKAAIEGSIPPDEAAMRMRVDSQKMKIQLLKQGSSNAAPERRQELRDRFAKLAVVTDAYTRVSDEFKEKILAIQARYDADFREKLIGWGIPPDLYGDNLVDRLVGLCDTLGVDIDSELSEKDLIDKMERAFKAEVARISMQNQAAELAEAAAAKRRDGHQESKKPYADSEVGTSSKHPGVVDPQATDRLSVADIINNPVARRLMLKLNSFGIEGVRLDRLDPSLFNATILLVLDKHQLIQFATVPSYSTGDGKQHIGSGIRASDWWHWASGPLRKPLGEYLPEWIATEPETRRPWIRLTKPGTEICAEIAFSGTSEADHLDACVGQPKQQQPLKTLVSNKWSKYNIEDVEEATPQLPDAPRESAEWVEANRKNKENFPRPMRTVKDYREERFGGRFSHCLTFGIDADGNRWRRKVANVGRVFYYKPDLKQTAEK